MKRIDGQPVGNAATRLRVNVTAADIRNGKPLNPNACAIAVACVRQVDGVTAAKVHLGRVYLLIHGKWKRWHMPEYGRIEVIAFDRGGKFVPQEIDLMPPPVNHLAKLAKAEQPYRKRTTGGPRARRRPPRRRRR